MQMHNMVFRCDRSVSSLNMRAGSRWDLDVLRPRLSVLPMQEAEARSLERETLIGASMESSGLMPPLAIYGSHLQ